MMRCALAVGALALVLTGCGDEEAAPPSTTGVTVTVGEPLPVGASYEDQSGSVTLTVHGVRITGGLLLADAEACLSASALPSLPIQATAWQLRLRGRQQTVPRINVDQPNHAASPPWPDDVELEAGECFEGKVAFRLPDAGPATEIVFTQLSTPVAWTVRT
ncbi:MAG TPA: hypothetical protein VIT24_03230 [Acidimicrobiales bacterium]|jgi:hypothetical protein